MRQVKAFLDKEKRLKLAKRFVEGAMANIKYVVRKHRLSKLDCEMGDVNNIQQLMQREGQCRHRFYRVIDESLPDVFKIEKRSIRPPSNRANAVLSFLNSLVYTRVATEIFHTHLHPSVSFLHEPFERRYSLALDVAEVFKPLLSEKLFLKCVRLKMLDPKVDFLDKNGVFLSSIGLKKLTRLFEEEINKTVRMRRKNTKRSIKQLIRMELYKLEKDLLGMAEYRPLKAWW